MKSNYWKYSRTIEDKLFHGFEVLRNLLTKILIPLFVLSSIIMPRDNFNIKIFLWTILLIISIPTIVHYIGKTSYLFYSFYIFLYPLYLIIISQISHQNIHTSLSAVYIFSYLILVFICDKNRINYTKIFMNTLTIMSFLITLSALLDIVGIMDIYQNPILTFLSLNGEAQVSKSSNAMFYYVLFLKASPLLLVHFTYNLHEKNLLRTTVSFFAILFSGTRANIFLSSILILFHFYFIQKNNYIKIFFTFFIIFLLMFFGTNLYDKVNTINDAKSIGDGIRTITSNAIVEEMNTKPIRYLIGMGFGSEYYSPGRGKFVSTSELSYYELVRQMGIIGAIPFLHFILKPIKLLYKSKKWLFISYISYLIISWVDPLLFTSTAFMLYVLVYFNYEEIKGGM